MSNKITQKARFLSFWLIIGILMTIIPVGVYAEILPKETTNETELVEPLSSTAQKEYYINNKKSGRFLSVETSLMLYSERKINTEYTLSNGVYDRNSLNQWILEPISNNQYYIKSSVGAAIYGTGSTSYPSVNAAIFPISPDSSYLWEVRYIPSSNDYRIKNVENGGYLSIVDGTIKMSKTYSAECAWRLSTKDIFVLMDSFTVNDVLLDVGESGTPTIETIPSNSTWTSISDFQMSTSNESVALINGSVITHKKSGDAVIMITHKPTNKSITFKVKNPPISTGVYNIKDVSKSSEEGYVCVDFTEPYDEYDQLPICLLDLDIPPAYMNKGKSLWGFVLLDDYTYKIISLSHGDNDGNENMALTYNASKDDLYLTKYIGEDGQKWIIDVIGYEDGQYPIITLATKENPDIKLAVGEENEYLIKLDESFENDMIIWGGFYKNHLGSNESLNLLIVSDEQVVTSLFGDDIDIAYGLLREAINKWNGLTPKVTLTLMEDMDPTISYCKVYLQCSTNQLNNTRYAVTMGYSNGGESVQLDSVHDYCTIYFNLTLINQNLADDQIKERQYIIIHELGHALMLTHPSRDLEVGDTIIESYVLSVMGRMDFETGEKNRALYEPGMIDIYMLNKKWN